ncbi:MAG: hypothetical protein NTX91_05440 [candidate division SR1 bacterium]|nr:hypothetical protein [candidate division SR1 bacterium]
MIIRKIRKDGIVNVRKVVKWVIVIAVVLIVLKAMSYLRSSQNNSTGITVDQIGKEVTIDGYLSPDNQFPYYTHSIVDKTKDKMGLKSATVNLNNYKGQVEIIGKVEKFLKFTPIIEVTAIKLPSQRVVIKNNSYFFADQFFILDFSDQSQLSAVGSGNEIIVLFDNKPVVTIERFICSKLLKGQNCNILIDDYIKNSKDNFTSLRGYSFYKHNDTTWTVFAGETFGYVFKNIDDDMMLNLSNMIKLVDENFILANKASQIKDACGATEILSSEVKYKTEGTFTITIKGKTKEKNTVDCSLGFDPWNQWSIKKLSVIK